MYYQIAWKRLRILIQPLLDYRPTQKMLIIICSCLLLLAIIAGSSLLDDFLASRDVRKALYTESEDGLKTKAPELSSDLDWIETKPQKIGQANTKVTVLNFWNSTCASCLDANSAVNNWQKKYHQQGLQVIGINVPDFSFEAEKDYIKKSIKAQNLIFPNAIDLSFETTDEYELGRGSLIVIIDSSGIVRHRSIDAVDLRNTELVIQELLKDAGVKEEFQVPSGEPTKVQQSPISIYFGSADDKAKTSFVGSDDLSDNKQTYTASPNLRLGEWSIAGTWRRTSEFMQVLSDGEIHTKINGSRVYVVADPPKNGFIGVSIDGQTNKLAPNVDKDGILDAEGPNLYQLVASRKKLKNSDLIVAPSDGTKVYQLVVLP